MRIARKSPLSGKWNTMEIAVTPEQMKEFESWPRRLIQDIFPDLTVGEREFIKTGYTQEDWDQLFPPEKE